MKVFVNRTGENTASPLAPIPVGPSPDTPTPVVPAPKPPGDGPTVHEVIIAMAALADGDRKPLDALMDKVAPKVPPKGPK